MGSLVLLCEEGQVDRNLETGVVITNLPNRFFFNFTSDFYHHPFCISVVANEDLNLSKNSN